MGCCSSAETKEEPKRSNDAATEPLAKDTTGAPPAEPLKERESGPTTAEWVAATFEPVRDPHSGGKVPPATGVTRELWTAVERNVLPPHVYGRKLRLLHCTDVHGYNVGALRRACDMQREQLKSGQDGFCVFVVRTGSTVVGALLNVLPEWNTKGRRTYIGGPATTVFACDSDGGNFAAFRASDDGNDRFFRADDHALTFGSGAAGAAIRIDEGLTGVKCCPCGETFAGLEEASVLDAPKSRGAAGLSDDVGGVRGKVSSLELIFLTEAVVA